MEALKSAIIMCVSITQIHATNDIQTRSFAATRYTYSHQNLEIIDAHNVRLNAFDIKYNC